MGANSGSTGVRVVSADDAFGAFVRDAEVRLRRAFVAAYGTDRAAEATAEALAWAWEHRDRLSSLENPVGYLYRVGQSRTRGRRRPLLPAPEVLGVPDIEPGLIPAVMALPARQRAVVWLVHACGWRHTEVAEALGISASAVATHSDRGLSALRRAIGGASS